MGAPVKQYVPAVFPELCHTLPTFRWDAGLQGEAGRSLTWQAWTIPLPRQAGDERPGSLRQHCALVPISPCTCEQLGYYDSRRRWLILRDVTDHVIAGRL